MSKYCMKCGAKLDDDAVFCDECGAKQMAINGNVAKEQKNSHTKIPPKLQNDNILVEIAKPQRHSFIGIIGFIFGLIGLLTFGVLIVPEILGILFGYLGTRDASKKQGLAKAGMILSIISIVLLVFLMFIV